MQNKPLRILLTGGHAHATAYATIKELLNIKKDISLYWIGPASLVEGENVKGVEETIFKEMGVTVINIDSGRLQTRFSRFTISSILKIPIGFFKSYRELKKINPDVVVSFGGFLGFPVVFAAWLIKIPTVLHEQTVVAGRGNIMAAKFADKVAISRESSRRYFPKDKLVFTGNPIDQSILEVRKDYSPHANKTIFVTGGHSGASFINNAIVSALPILLNKYKVIHQCGKTDFARLSKVKAGLKSYEYSRYDLRESIDPRSWPNVLAQADIVVSRAGANTVSQIVALKIPSILIPIPSTYLSEQEKNADYAVEFGVALKIEQEKLTTDNLIGSIDYLFKNFSSIFKSASKKESPDLLASENFAKLILNEAKK